MDNYSEKINKSQEYYCLDNINDFYNINTIHTYFFFGNSKNEKDEVSIYILYNDKFKSLPFSRNKMKKIFDFYSFIKIYKDNNYINILINGDRNTPESILDKINSITSFKEEIEKKLRINFPIIDYALTNIKENVPNHKNNDIIQPHKIFVLKKIDKETLKILKSMKKMQTEKKSSKYTKKFLMNNNNDNLYNKNNGIFLMNNFLNNKDLNNNMNKKGNNNINNNNHNMNNNNMIEDSKNQKQGNIINYFNEDLISQNDCNNKLENINKFNNNINHNNEGELIEEKMTEDIDNMLKYYMVQLMS